MMKRTLPQRSTRGQLPPHLRQPPSPLNIKTVICESPEETLRKEKQSIRRLCQINNLKHYPYPRAFHYFFELSNFDRIIGHPSYIEDKDNALKNTFSSDDKVLNGSKIGQIINRKYMGLPFNPQNKLAVKIYSRTKNVCNGYLNDIEDKRYNCDRVINTLKIILKKIEKQQKNMDYYLFQTVKKDPDLQILMEEQATKEQKLDALLNKISILQNRKQINNANKQFQDTIYYYHSLNQKLHNQINSLKQKISVDYLRKLLFEKDDMKELLLKNEYQNIYNFIIKASNYYESDNNTLQGDTLQCLINLYLNESEKHQSIPNFLINFPVVILQFGNGDILHQLVGYAIARRCYSIGEVHFYQAKSMVKKLFNKDLHLKVQKINNYQQYFKLYKKRYEDIKRKNCNRVKQNQRARTLLKQDHINNFKQNLILNLQINQALFSKSKKIEKQHLFNISNKILINGRQYIFIMLYYWISQSLQNIHSYLQDYTDLLSIISSDFFPKVCNSFVEAIETPLSGLISHSFQTLTQLLCKPDPFSNIENISLSFEFDPIKNVGVIYRDIQSNQNSSQQQCKLSTFIRIGSEIQFEEVKKCRKRLKK